MSGGHFNYAYSTVSNFADELELELDRAGTTDRHGDSFPEVPYPVAHEMREIAKLAEYTSRLMREVEWYFSGDTGDESFLERAKEIKKDNAYWNQKEN